jgi:putative peptidoglycan lipid II flippase
MIPATIGASIYQITIFIATVLASLLPVGSVSWLFYADRVAQFPIGIFSIALASVLLPALSTASAQADESAFRRNMANSLRFTSFCIIPMAAGIWALALPMTQLLFERGAFSHEATIKTSLALQALCFGLWASSCHSMVIRAFISRKDTSTPTLIGIASLFVNMGASLLLMGPLVSGLDASWAVTTLTAFQQTLAAIVPVSASLGHVGLAYASSIAAGVSLSLAIALYYVRIGGFPWSDFVISSVKSMVAASALIISITLSNHLQLSPGATCAVGMVAGSISFCAASYLLGSRELRETVALVRSKLG